jgi:phosphonate transport system substrate-binding protein
MRKWLLALLTIFIVCIASACDEEGSAAKSDNQPEEASVEPGVSNEVDRTDWPDQFIFGLLPVEDQGELLKRYDPLIDYLEKYLGIEVELYNATNYTALIEAMANGHIHGSSFGPFSYLVANERANGEAFVVPVDVEGGSIEDIFYTAQMITLEDHGIDGLEDIEDRSLAYADPASTSGHLFPKAILINELNLTMDNVDEFPSNVVFSGSHEASLYSVLNGDVEAAGVCSSCIERIFDRVEDHENFDQLKVFHESAPIPGGPYVIQGDLPQSFKDEVKQAFLDMNDDPKGQEFLEANGYLGGYFEVEHDVYKVVEDTADALNMSPEELLN